MTQQLTLYHISDLHFCDKSLKLSQLISEGSLFSKQSIGWMNYRFRRGKIFPPERLRKLVDKLSHLTWDYLVISGDITNLASRYEFEKARERLEPLIQKGPVLFTAGNHDRYIQASAEPDLMEEYFRDCFPFNRKRNNQTSHIIELNSSTVLIEINTAVVQNLISSKGKITPDLNKVGEELQKYQNHFKIAVGHYPVVLPDGITEGYFHSLHQSDILEKFLTDQKVDLYLHGHIHKSWHYQPDSGYPTTHINSGGCCRHAEGAHAGFHKIEIMSGNAHIERVEFCRNRL